MYGSFTWVNGAKIELAKKLGISETEKDVKGSVGIEFNAQTRMSGTDFSYGHKVRKGAVGAVKEYVQQQGGSVPFDLEGKSKEIAMEGGTPLAVADGPIEAKPLGRNHLWVHYQ